MNSLLGRVWNDKSMNTHQIIIILAAMLAGCATPHGTSPDASRSASLGQTHAQITKELGPPTAQYMNGFVLFHDQGNEVQSHFQGGKADALFYYTFKKKITEPWLSSTLSLNSKGTPWVLEASAPSGRKVYYTTDRKYHAFVSKGNQLLVVTDEYYRRVLHHPSKELPADELPECMFAPDHEFATIGSSEAKIARNYGDPSAVFKDGFKDYFDGCMKIQVHYANGVCDAVLYKANKDRKFTDCWTSRLLGMNSRGQAWIVRRDSTPNEVGCRTPDCKLAATLVKNETMIVSTDQFRRWLLRGKGELPPRQPGESVLYPDCTRVFLGQTEAKMTERLGKPTTGRDPGVKIYHDNHVEVRASFEDGVCNKIKYFSDKGRKFSTHWVSATLCLNSHGSAWVVYQGSTPKKTYYRTCDVKVYARLTNGNELGILTDQLVERASRRLEDRKKSKAAISSQL